MPILGLAGLQGLTELFDLDKPVIAAVNGYAFGGGFELALAADFIICAENASFALPEAKLGIVPDSGGVLRLPKRLPPAIVNEMVMTGRRMNAEEALRWGIAQLCCQSGSINGEGARTGTATASKRTAGYCRIKRDNQNNQRNAGRRRLSLSP
jgi:enoyl-CoA hydratase/carnithine racemase